MSFNKQHFLSLASIVIWFLYTSHSSAAPQSQPESKTKKFWKSITGLIDADKIPSVELKVGYDGVYVSTGPSREQMYWTIGLWIGGVTFAFAFLIGFIFLCCCFYKKTRRSQMQVHSLWSVPRVRRLHLEVPGSFMVLNPTLGTPIGSSRGVNMSTNNTTRGFTNVGHGVWAPK